MIEIDVEVVGSVEAEVEMGRLLPSAPSTLPLSLETIRSFGTLGVTGAETEMEV